VERIVPSTLIPPGRSSLATIEREILDTSNIFNTTDFDATQLIRAAQLCDSLSVQRELGKYRFPEGLVEHVTLRAAFLGFSPVVAALTGAQRSAVSCRSSLNILEGLSPLHVAALMGQPTVARVLLHGGGADRSLRAYAEVLRGFFGDAEAEAQWRAAGGFTALEVARAVANSVAPGGAAPRSAVLMVLDGDVCLCCGRLLSEKGKLDAQTPLAAPFSAMAQVQTQAQAQAQAPPGAGDSQQSPRTALPVSPPHARRAAPALKQHRSEEIPLDESKPPKSSGRLLLDTSHDAFDTASAASGGSHRSGSSGASSLSALSRPFKSLLAAFQRDWEQSVPRAPPSDAPEQLRVQQLREQQQELRQREGQLERSEQQQPQPQQHPHQHPHPHHVGTAAGGDYCAECREAMDRRNRPVATVLDIPLGRQSWHCRHCRTVTLGQRTVTCKRCRFSFCQACAFTRRRLLPEHETPVEVCINCHHFLRSCPCHLADTSSRVFDVLCDHSAIDYASETAAAAVALARAAHAATTKSEADLQARPASGQSPGASSGPGEGRARTAASEETCEAREDAEEPAPLHVCECQICLKRRYTLRAPAIASRPASYDPAAPLFTCQEAITRGFWGNGDRSLLSVSTTTRTEQALRQIQQIEDFVSASMVFSATLSTDPGVLHSRASRQLVGPRRAARAGDHLGTLSLHEGGEEDGVLSQVGSRPPSPMSFVIGGTLGAGPTASSAASSRASHGGSSRETSPRSLASDSKQPASTPGAGGGLGAAAERPLASQRQLSPSAHGGRRRRNSHSLVAESSSMPEEVAAAAAVSAAAVAAYSASENRFRDFRSELIEFYATRNPSQLGQVDNLLQKYRGREEQLLDDLHRMYAT
jgi:hypothetical protein